ncbi:MAG: diguanylate cyclase [Candidatus Omnitrophica bacterium]|nr:diguanylate cyclase [Candidatus Omnitrophota bacterium]
MGNKRLKFLVVEADTEDIKIIQDTLSDSDILNADLDFEGSLKDALSHLATKQPDAILLDPNLPDSEGLKSLQILRDQAKDLPIVVMASDGDTETGVRAIRRGAQDYLIKGKVDVELLSRSVRYALERQRILGEVRSLSMIDELSGLYNRRGFLAMVQQQMEIGIRAKQYMLLVFVDVDGLKAINDTYGHQTGDQALVETANLMKDHFRRADILARIGGDEFAVLAIDAKKESAEAIKNRINQGIDAWNKESRYEFDLSVSLGIGIYDPDNPCSVDALLAQADFDMYREKNPA